MFKTFKLFALTAIALTAATLAGCGQPSTPAEQAAYEVMGLSAPGEGRMGQAGPRGMFKDLALTEAQQAQFKAIAQKHRGERKPANFKDQRAQLKTLLLADKVDGAALRSFLQARAQEMAAQAPNRFTMMAEMRDVLTAEQRAKLIERLSKERPEAAKPKFEGMRAKMKERMLADLSLTPAQQQAFDALEAKLQAQRGGQHGQASKQALVSFLQNGDKAAFENAMKAGVQPKLPVDEVVALAESLDKAQREKLVAKFERFAQMRGGHKGGKRHGQHHQQ